MPTPKRKKSTKRAEGSASGTASATNSSSTNAAATKVPSVDSYSASNNSLPVSPQLANKRVVKRGTGETSCEAKQPPVAVNNATDGLQGGNESRKRRSSRRASLSQQSNVSSPSSTLSVKNSPGGKKRKSAFEIVKQSPAVDVSSVVNSDSSPKVVKKVGRKASDELLKTEQGKKSKGRRSAFQVKVSEPLEVVLVESSDVESDAVKNLLSDECHDTSIPDVTSPCNVAGKKKKNVRNRRSKMSSSDGETRVDISSDCTKDGGEEVEIRGDNVDKGVLGHGTESSEIDDGVSVGPELVQMNNLSESCHVFRITTDTDAVQEVVMVLDHPLEFCIRGRVSLQSLHGCVSVHGHFIPAGDKLYNIYSPACSSSLTVCTVSSQNKDSDIKSQLKSYLGDTHSSLINCISKLLKPNSVILRLKELHSKTCDYLTSGSLYQNLFSVKGHLTGELPELNSDLSPIGLNVHRVTSSDGVHISDGAHQVAEQLIKDVGEGRVPVVAICGGKNSGKSTLVRYLVNSLLNFTSSVGVLDCDPGQTEFTLPGCVSFTAVEEPLLGPPFTHMLTCSRTVFTGALSPASDPQHYVKCLQYVYEGYSERAPAVPLIVNTMGWNQGLGLVFMSDTLRLVRPSLVVQLDSASRNKNFPPLTSGFVCRTQGWMDRTQGWMDRTQGWMDRTQGWMDRTQEWMDRTQGWMDRTQLTEKDYNHELLIIDSANDFNKEKLDHFGAVDFRNLAIQAYFAPVLTSGAMSINAVKPYIVPWSAVAVHICHMTVPRDQIMLSLNGTVVALCNIDTALVTKSSDPSLPSFLSEKPVCSVVGFGLIRAIDPSLKVFYVVTPVPLSDLGSVNCFLKGSIELPEHLLKSQDIPNCTHLPYIDHVPDGFGGIKQRQFLQRRRYGGQTLLD